MNKVNKKSSFYFKQRNIKLDIRSITNIDIDNIINNVDIDILQSKLELLTFSELNENDLKSYTDNQIIKLFRLSQLVIEYLLYAQERLVVDINSLSSKYNDKKKSLLRKRKELESLKESCQELKSQVKSKKGNIETLESLLKGAVISNKKQYDDINVDNKNVLVEKPLPHTNTKPALAHFYVSGPDGLCIEFKEHWNTIVSDIIIDFRRRYPNANKDEDIKLINRGRILLNDNTIEESDVKCGDNLVVRIIEKVEKTKESTPLSKSHPSPNEVQNLENNFVLEVKDLTTTLVSEMMKGYGKQQDNINDTLVEMRRGWEGALKSLAATQQQMQQQQQQPVYVPIQQPVVSEKFDDKVYKALESSVINKLTTQIEEQEKQFEKQLQAAVINQKSVHIGDIESDTDDDPMKSKSYETILEKIAPAINSMQSEIKQLKTLVETVAKKKGTDDDDEVFDKSSRKIKEIDEVETITETESFVLPSPDKSLELNKVVKFDDVVIVQDIESVEKIEQISDEETIVKNDKNDDNLFNTSIESEKIDDMDSVLESAANSVLHIQDISDGEIFNSSIIVNNKNDESTVMQLESADNSILMTENNISMEEVEEVPALEVPVLEAQAVADQEKKETDIDDLNSKKIEDDLDQEVEVSIVFAADHNHDLEMLSLPQPDIEIPVPADFSKDELVLEIRRYVAEEAQISLSRISLVLNGKTITHGMDVDNSFTAANVSKLAKSGELTLSIKSLSQAPPQPTASTLPLASSKPIPQVPKAASSVTMSNSELAKIVSEVNKQDSRAAHDDRIAGHFQSTRTSLDKTLNSLSDAEGLTDDELAEKLSDLRRLKEPIAPHIDEHHGSISGVLGNLSNISAEDNISIEKPDYLRLSLSNINRRSYDDDSLELPKFVDEPITMKNSKASPEIVATKSKARSTLLESSESLAGAKRLDSVLRDDHEIASSIQKSNSLFNRESNDEYSTQFDSLTSSNLYGARETDAPAMKTTKESINSWDSSNISDENYAVDLDKTIDSNASGPTDVRMSAVLRKADEYERKASTDHTPIKDYKSTSKASTPSIASPFDNLIKSDYKSAGKKILEDYDGNDSLALSDDSGKF